MSFIIKPLEVGPMLNLCYMIGDQKTRQAFIIDPSWAPSLIMSTVEKEGYKLSGLIVSHAHYDHVNAVEGLLMKHDVPVYAQIPEIEYAQSGANVVGSLGSTVKPIEGEQTLTLGETDIKCLPTPGHTPGSQCLQVGDYLLTGDTLFIGGCGRSDLPGGNPEVLFASLNKISKLSPSLMVCPGHNYGPVAQRPLADEIKENRYLKMTRVDEFIDVVS